MTKKLLVILPLAPGRRLQKRIDKDSLLKVQSCQVYNNKCMIASTQITNTEIFTFVAVRVFQLLNRKALFINRKDNRNC